MLFPTHPGLALVGVHELRGCPVLQAEPDSGFTPGIHGNDPNQQNHRGEVRGCDHRGRRSD